MAAGPRGVRWRRRGPGGHPAMAPGADGAGVLVDWRALKALVVWPGDGPRDPAGRLGVTAGDHALRACTRASEPARFLLADRPWRRPDREWASGERRHLDHCGLR